MRMLRHRAGDLAGATSFCRPDDLGVEPLECSGSRSCPHPPLILFSPQVTMTLVTMASEEFASGSTFVARCA